MAGLDSLRWVADFPKLTALLQRHRLALTVVLAPIAVLALLDLGRCLYRGPARDTFLGLTLVASRMSFMASLSAASALALFALWRGSSLRSRPTLLVAWLAFIVFTANGMAF